MVADEDDTGIFISMAPHLSGERRDSRIGFSVAGMHEAMQSRESSMNSTSHKTILLAEDDEPTKAIVRTALETKGYVVISATRRAELMTLIETGRYDLVLTDVLMPEVNGIEVIQAVRRFRPNTPILAMSGGSADMTSELTLKAAEFVGAGRVLVKPFEVEQLLAAVAEALLPKEGAR